ncbi:MAG: fibronectin type III domain-containing protein [Acidobacteria bacterium]|nr:fibronectin type III domain-containing protein [Acidobacteriota bacterium]
MSKKYYQMNPAELLGFLTNFQNVANERKDELGLNDVQLTDIDAMRARLAEKIGIRQSTREAAAAAVVDLDETADEAAEMVGSLSAGFKSNRAISSEMFEMLGLDARAANRSTVHAVAPADLVVDGRSNGVNYLKWKSGGNKSRTTYVIEAKFGAAHEYVFVKAQTRTRFEHKNQTPGVRVFYRVKAVRADEESVYSNEAVVYN